MDFINQTQKKSDQNKNQKFTNEILLKQSLQVVQLDLKIQNILLYPEFNIDKLRGLINEINKVENSLHGKDIVVFIGQTGSGKSTTINLLLEVPLKEVQDDKGQTIYCQVNENKGAKIGSTTTSMTSIIQSYQKDNYLIIDTPGYKDTRGIEIDIANQIGVTQSLKQCKSARVVIVIDFNDLKAQRAQGFLETLETVLKVIKEFDQNLQSFMFFITKTDKNINMKELYNFLEDLKQSLKSNKNIKQKQYIDVIDEMMNNMGLEDEEDEEEVQETKVFLIKPSKLINNPIQVRNLWEDIQNQEAIGDPQNIFQFTITPKVVQIIQSYSRFQNQILNKNFDNVLIVKSVLNNMFLLYNYLSNKEVYNQFELSVQELEKYIQNKIKNNKIALQEYFTNNINTNTQELFSEIIKYENYLKNLQQQQVFFYLENVNYLETYKKDIYEVVQFQMKNIDDIKYLEELEKDYKENFFTFDYSKDEFNLNFLKKQTKIKKYQELIKFNVIPKNNCIVYQSFLIKEQNKYKDIVIYWIQQYGKNFKSYSDNQKFIDDSSIQHTINIFNNLISNFKQICGNNYFQQIEEQMIQQIINLKPKLEKLEEVQQLLKNISKLYQICQQKFSDQIKQRCLQEYSKFKKEIVDKCIKYYEDIVKIIQIENTTINQKQFDINWKYIQICEDLDTEIQIEIMKNYGKQYVIQEIKNSLNKLIKEQKKYLNKLKFDGNTILFQNDISEIQQIMQKLISIQWLDESLNCNMIITQFIDDSKKYLQDIFLEENLKMSDILKEFDFNLETQESQNFNMNILSNLSNNSSNNNSIDIIQVKSLQSQCQQIRNIFQNMEEFEKFNNQVKIGLQFKNYKEKQKEFLQQIVDKIKEIIELQNNQLNSYNNGNYQSLSNIYNCIEVVNEYLKIDHFQLNAYIKGQQEYIESIKKTIENDYNYIINLENDKFNTQDDIKQLYKKVNKIFYLISINEKTKKEITNQIIVKIVLNQYPSTVQNKINNLFEEKIEAFQKLLNQSYVNVEIKEHYEFLLKFAQQFSKITLKNMENQDKPHVFLHLQEQVSNLKNINDTIKEQLRQAMDDEIQFIDLEMFKNLIKLQDYESKTQINKIKKKALEQLQQINNDIVDPQVTASQYKNFQQFIKLQDLFKISELEDEFIKNMIQISHNILTQIDKSLIYLNKLKEKKKMKELKLRESQLNFQFKIVDHIFLNVNTIQNQEGYEKLRQQKENIQKKIENFQQQNLTYDKELENYQLANKVLIQLIEVEDDDEIENFENLLIEKIESQFKEIKDIENIQLKHNKLKMLEKKFKPLENNSQISKNFEKLKNEIQTDIDLQQENLTQNIENILSEKFEDKHLKIIQETKQKSQSTYEKFLLTYENQFKSELSICQEFLNGDKPNLQQILIQQKKLQNLIEFNKDQILKENKINYIKQQIVEQHNQLYDKIIKVYDYQKKIVNQQKQYFTKQSTIPDLIAQKLLDYQQQGYENLKQYLLSVNLAQVITKKQDKQKLNDQIEDIFKQINDLIYKIFDNYIIACTNNQIEKQQKIYDMIQQVYYYVEYFNNYSNLKSDEKFEKSLNQQIYKLINDTVNLCQETDVNYKNYLNPSENAQQLCEKIIQEWDKQEFQKVSKIYNELKQLKEKQFQNIFTEVNIQLLDKIEKNSLECQKNIKDEQFKQLQINYTIMENSQNNLHTITDLYKLNSQIKIVNQKLDEYLEEQSYFIVDAIQQEEIQEELIQQIAKTMANLQKITLDAHCVKKQVISFNENLIAKIQNKFPGIIEGLSQSFQQLEDGDLKLMGQEIISQCISFKQINLQMYKQLVNCFNEDKILKSTQQYRKGKLLDVQNDYEVLKKRFTKVKEYYNIFMEHYLKLPNFQNKKEILQEIKKIIKINTLELKNWNDKCKEATIQILAYIFAAWSLLEINQKEIQKGNFQYREPNTAQILAILMIFRCEIDQGIWATIKNVFQNISFDNQIIQILTGEGKSILIGVISAFLSLIGYNVHAVCYSKYLSQRDQEDFQALHEFLEVDQYIVYGTFKEISELNLLENINLRGATLNLVDPNYYIQNQKKQYGKKRPQILFIDEVDVFFHEDFYGRTLNPSASLQSDEIKDIFYLIWEEGKPSQQNNTCRYSFKELQVKILNSEEYDKLISKYKEWKELINSHIDEIINCIVNFSKKSKQIDYQVQNDQIGYKQTDHTLSFSTQYSYHTTFTYFYEHQNQNISQESLDSILSINLLCGNLSYAESPFNYEYILGVTGTLKTLHEDIKNQLQIYNIKQQTYIPSMFGASNIQWDKKNQQYFSVEQNYDDQLNKIVTILTNNTQNKLPSLIFFDSKQQLYDFYNHYSFQQFKNQFEIQILEESIEQQDKEQYIRKSTMKGYITLSTKEYGRGTDFICRDERVNNNGGVKVIQTFLSLELSEEIQIKGRTGRQGKPGQYHLIINFEQLEKDYECQWLTIQNNKTNDILYEYLNDIRNKKQSYIIAQYREYIQDSKSLHDKTAQYIKYLQKDVNKAKEQLKILNKY